jgi:transposase-like protein
LLNPPESERGAAVWRFTVSCSIEETMTEKIRRSYGDTERAEAIGLAMTLGSKEASRRTGVPRRTISFWLAKEGQRPTIITAESREAVADRLWQTLVKAADAVEAGLAKGRLGDVARALEVLVHAHELLAGHATQNVALAVGSSGDDLTDDEAAQLSDWLRVNAAAIEAAEVAALEAGGDDDA